jgi:hypothetical protein
MSGGLSSQECILSGMHPGGVPSPVTARTRFIPGVTGKKVVIVFPGGGSRFAAGTIVAQGTGSDAFAEAIVKERFFAAV